MKRTDDVLVTVFAFGMSLFVLALTAVMHFVYGVQLWP